MTRPRRAVTTSLLALLLVAAIPLPATAADASPSPTATADPSTPPPSPSPTPVATATPDPTAAPGPSTSASPDPTQTPAPTIVAEASASTAASHTPSPSPTATPSSDPSPTPTTDPSPTPSPSPSPSPSPTAPARINLYRSTAMVRQFTDYWCVPAATQSMVNILLGTSDRRYLRQKYIYKLTRLHNRYTYRTLGNDPQGWAWSLRYFSRNTANYQARAYNTKTAAINAIVASIGRTRDPVGVPIRWGTHAWVILGYRMAVDPVTSKRTLLGLYTSGPLGTWSDSWPYRYLTVAQFRQVFTPYHEWQRSVIWEGKYVVVGQ